nr:hypothetical protein [Tanacetum cinerariifolium]
MPPPVLTRPSATTTPITSISSPQHSHSHHLVIATLTIISSPSLPPPHRPIHASPSPHHYHRTTTERGALGLTDSSPKRVRWFSVTQKECVGFCLNPKGCLFLWLTPEGCVLAVAKPPSRVRLSHFNSRVRLVL